MARFATAAAPSSLCTGSQCFMILTLTKTSWFGWLEGCVPKTNSLSYNHDHMTLSYAQMLVLPFEVNRRDIVATTTALRENVLLLIAKMGSWRLNRSWIMVLVVGKRCYQPRQMISFVTAPFFQG